MLGRRASVRNSAYEFLVMLLVYLLKFFFSLKLLIILLWNVSHFYRYLGILCVTFTNIF